MNQAQRARLAEVNDQISAARENAQDRWKEFESARERVANGGKIDTSSSLLSAAETAHAAYTEASSELDKLESARNLVFGEIAETKEAESGPKAGEDGSWLAAALRDARTRPGFALAGGER